MTGGAYSSGGGWPLSCLQRVLLLASPHHLPRSAQPDRLVGTPETVWLVTIRRSSMEAHVSLTGRFDANW